MSRERLKKPIRYTTGCLHPAANPIIRDRYKGKP
jgi:hypothetical protein